MAAENTDKFKKVARKWVGQIGSGGVADSSTTTIPLSSATGLPTDTAVEVVIDRVDANGTKTPTSEETVVGVISGSNLTECVRGVEGTAQAHSAGAVVEVLITADNWNDMVDGLMAEHAQDGGHDLATGISVVEINDTSGNEEIKFTATASAVNEFTIANAITASEPTLSVTGGDTNIGLKLTPKGTGKVQITANDLNLGAAAANIQIANADPKRGIYVPASAMYGATTSGAASGQIETTTNKVNVKVLDFDKDADESAHFAIPSPLYWDASTVTVTPYWTTTAGTTGTVVWSIAAMSFANDDALDQAYGTAVTSTDTFILASDVHIAPTTAAITVGGTPTAGDWVQFKILRDISEDTLDNDARLLGVRVTFGIAKYTDE